MPKRQPIPFCGTTSFLVTSKYIGTKSSLGDKFFCNTSYILTSQSSYVLALMMYLYDEILYTYVHCDKIN